MIAKELRYSGPFIYGFLQRALGNTVLLKGQTASQLVVVESVWHKVDKPKQLPPKKIDD